jgi:hypothetical protein
MSALLDLLCVEVVGLAGEGTRSGTSGRGANTTVCHLNNLN